MKRVVLAHCFVADPVRRAAHPELLLAPVFWAGERPLPGAEELLVALLGAVCLEELDDRCVIGAACKQTANPVRPWTSKRQSYSGIRTARSPRHHCHGMQQASSQETCVLRRNACALCQLWSPS